VGIPAHRLANYFDCGLVELEREAKDSDQPFQREWVSVDLQTKASNQLQGQATPHRLAP
jgi:hypothetical protein